MKIINYTIFLWIILVNFSLSQWEQTTEVNGNSINCLAIKNNTIFVGSEAGGVFLSTDYGTNWSQVNNGLTNISIISLAVKDSNIFAGTWNNGVFLSTNNGSNWSQSGLPNIHIWSFAVSGSNIFATGDSGYFPSAIGLGIFLSTNNGSDWSQVNNGLTNLNVSSLAVKDSNIFAGTYIDGAFLSTDNGSSWTLVGLANFGVKSFSVSGSNIFAIVSTPGFPSGAPEGIFLSTNNGSDWSQVNNGLTNLNIYCFAVSDNNIFCSGQDGVFLTTNNGSNWLPVNDGLPGTETPSTLAICGPYIFTGTREGHIWRRQLSEMITTINETHSYNPNQYVLRQNFPNPFNPSTKIKYQLPNTGFVTLKVYDVLGNEVATLVNEEKPAGSYEVEFQSAIGGRQLASGIYFYKIQVGSFVQARKMILLK